LPRNNTRKRPKRGDGESHPDRPRSFWSGTITFGLVSIPVDLYPGSRNVPRGLRMVDAEGNPLRREYFCPKDGAAVANEELARAYEVEGGELVPLTDQELAAAAPEKSRDIALRRFVERGEISRLHLRRTYYMLPAGGSTRAYHLLADTMERSQQAGLATFVMRDKEYLVAILADRGILRAEILRFADEVRTTEDVGLPDRPRVAKQAVADMQAAVDALSEDEIDPKELADVDLERIQALAKKKHGKGDDVVEVETTRASVKAATIDLMEVLKQRLEGSADEDETAAPARAGGKRRAHRTSSGPLGSRSKQELLSRARELEIEGRSAMNKEELVEAIRSASH
jgi:DNA end-binding protein Ku